MHIERLEVTEFPVPFKTVFRHASASRVQAENVIVMAYSDCGLIGYGEGCPRSYVTGETVESCTAFIQQYADVIADAIQDVGTLKEWIATNRSIIDRNPAAFCAVELAILDLFGRVMERPIEDLLGIGRLSGICNYSAVLSDAPHLVFWWQYRRYWKNGFREFKVKISGDPQRDRRKMRVLQNGSGGAIRVRLDANNLWTSADECIHHIIGLSSEFFAIEEPLQEGDLSGFRTVGEEIRTKIILDESLLRSDQLKMLNDGDRWIVNLRVSKMGGIIRSLEIANEASKRNIAIIIGAQVGETSILTRAALTVASAQKNRLVGQEGAFGTHLLRKDITKVPIMFGDGGRLDISQYANRTGSGVDCNL